MPLDDVDAWAASGAMALTGRYDGPALGPPAPLVPGLRGIADALARRSAQLGDAVVLDPLAVLGERAAIARLERHGRTSCGGATRLLSCEDGWLAVSLPRDEDVELLPAWLGIEPPAYGRAWHAVAAACASSSATDLADRGALLGLPVGALPREPAAPPRTRFGATDLPCLATRVADGPPVERLDGLVVVDLSSLWAGPLAGSILVDAGATVRKVESRGRPDGARRGPRAFFDLMNAGKHDVTFDLRAGDGRAAMHRLVASADVVIESSRPRALEQLGIVAAEVLAAGRPRVWLSITGHGRAAALRVGFGDDAAVAGGLVAWDDGLPCFCADAAADPVAGMVGAAAVLEALAAGGRWLVDVSLAGAAARLAGPTLPVPDGVRAAPPRCRTRTHRIVPSI